MIIAFDVDDTLIIPSVASEGRFDTDVPNYETIAIYRWFEAQGHTMVVWSGGGIDYAQMWANKLGLQSANIIEKEKGHNVDIAFDDCDVNLGRVNIKVKRVNNSISRKEWNKHRAYSRVGYK